jgi:hypothetical protein
VLKVWAFFVLFSVKGAGATDSLAQLPLKASAAAKVAGQGSQWLDTCFWEERANVQAIEREGE